MKLEELQVYAMSMDVAEEIWNLVKDWDYFSKDTIGKQFVRAADSFSANLSEGYGRYHYREKTNFNYYSRGSLFETKTWIVKAHNRNLINDEIFKQLYKTVEEIGVKLNNYISSTKPIWNCYIYPDSKLS